MIKAIIYIFIMNKFFGILFLLGKYILNIIFFYFFSFNILKTIYFFGFIYFIKIILIKKFYIKIINIYIITINSYENYIFNCFFIIDLKKFCNNNFIAIQYY